MLVSSVEFSVPFSKSFYCDKTPTNPFNYNKVQSSIPITFGTQFPLTQQLSVHIDSFDGGAGWKHSSRGHTFASYSGARHIVASWPIIGGSWGKIPAASNGRTQSLKSAKAQLAIAHARP
jgi:hypothetical protein